MATKDKAPTHQEMAAELLKLLTPTQRKGVEAHSVKKSSTLKRDGKPIAQVRRGTVWVALPGDAEAAREMLRSIAASVAGTED
jgi:hypothetical protein